MLFRPALLLTFGAVILHHIKAQSHNLIETGVVSPNDHLIYKLDHQKNAIVLKKRTTDINFPESGSSNNFVISSVVVKDHYENDNGGTATITGGGVGSKFVNIHLKSKRSRGMNFTIYVYGH